MTDSWLLSCPAMENTLPVLDQIKKKIYVWNLQAALKNVVGADDRNTQGKSSLLLFHTTSHFLSGTSSSTQSCAPINRGQPHLFSCRVRPLTPVLHLLSRPKKKTGLGYGNDFFGDESDHASRRAAPPHTTCKCTPIN
ncbi:hypothetical protein BDR06DRAFT_449462 [Suillus hirtellus]|nr:hypothetical protein BDR06DRAFT_449462 [Suillus hirtellus]